jgi:hypothetical protein
MSPISQFSSYSGLEFLIIISKVSSKHFILSAFSILLFSIIIIFIHKIIKIGIHILGKRKIKTRGKREMREGDPLKIQRWRRMQQKETSNATYHLYVFLKLM